MKWYTDYLSAYEKPYSELPPPLTNRVKKKNQRVETSQSFGFSGGYRS